MLLPLSIIYGIIAAIRRRVYDLLGLRKAGKLPSLVIGNLTVGGTGKTPMVVFISELLSNFQLAVLSRGYGRKTKGFLLLNDKSNATDVGDEPLEILESTNRVLVAVCEDRLEGISRISRIKEGTELVLLDDGFQHLPLKASAYVLLCNYNNPFYGDWVMPAGRLREFAFEAKNADIIVVSKCPPTLSKQEANTIKEKLVHYSSEIYFATYERSIPQCIYNRVENLELKENDKIVLVTGVANGKIVENEITEYDVIKHFQYGDHFAFNVSDLQEWKRYCLANGINKIFVTRKDANKILDCVSQMSDGMGSIQLFEIHTEVKILFEEENQFKNSLINII